MKRIISLLLIALLFAACQPTPETEFVINKGDNVLEQKLYATPEPVADTVSLHENASAAPESEPASEPTAAPIRQQLFPDRWDEDGIQLREHVTLSIHTDVITRADGQYPAYRTQAEPLTEDRITYFAEGLLSKPVKLELIEARSCRTSCSNTSTTSRNGKNGSRTASRGMKTGTKPAMIPRK